MCLSSEVSPGGMSFPAVLAQVESGCHGLLWGREMTPPKGTDRHPPCQVLDSPHSLPHVSP